METTSPDKEGIEKYTLTPNGLTEIFNKLSSEKPSQNDSILININLQYSGQKKYLSDTLYYTLCDCYNHFQYFIFKKPPFSFQMDEIVNIKDISYNYDPNKQFFSFIINQYEICSKALYQIYPYTNPFNVNKYLNIFSYIKKKPIDYLKYNVLSNLATLPKKLIFYVRVISKVTLTSFTINKEKKHDGNYFYFDVVDLNNDTIRIVATYSNANYYYSKIKINSIYIISGNFFLHELTRYQEHNKANPLYKISKVLKMPTKEIYIGNDSKIIEVDESDDSNLISIDENKLIIYNDIFTVLYSNNTFVDLVNAIGIVIKVGGCYKVTYAKRQIKLLDDTYYSIDVNLWNQYTLYPVKVGDILLIKNIQVKKNNDENFMTTVDETVIIINPENEKNNKLKSIYEEYLQSNNNIIKNKKNQNNLRKNSKKDNKNCCILKYMNNIKFNRGKFIFIEELINLKNNNNNDAKEVYGYIQKIIFDKIEDVVLCACLTCLKPLRKKGAFWYCLHCKKNYILPSYFFQDLILNIMDSTGKINVLIQKEKIKEIFGIFPEKMNNLEEIKKFEKKIRFDLFYFNTKNKYDKNGNLIIEHFNKVTFDKIKENDLSVIKNYINSLK